MKWKNKILMILMKEKKKFNKLLWNLVQLTNFLNKNIHNKIKNPLNITNQSNNNWKTIPINK
jgi:hypothetical protein